MKNKGFTLIELSIVLVIIGLLISGVLIGRDMMKSSEYRAQISQIETLNTTVMVFKNKYGCLPGDCATAVNKGLGVTGDASGDGDGDGQIYLSSNPFYSEFLSKFWYHLYNAKLITYDPAANTRAGNSFPVGPPTKLRGRGNGANTDNAVPSGQVGIIPSGLRNDAWDSTLKIDNSSNHAWLLYNNYFASGTTDGADIPLYSPEECYFIDKKIDDSLPETGKVFAPSFGDIANYNFAYNPPDIDVYGEGTGRTALIGTGVNGTQGDATYDITNKSTANGSMCALFIIAAF